MFNGNGPMRCFWEMKNVCGQRECGLRAVILNVYHIQNLSIIKAPQPSRVLTRSVPYTGKRNLGNGQIRVRTYEVGRGAVPMAMAESLWVAGCWEANW